MGLSATWFNEQCKVLKEQGGNGNPCHRKTDLHQHKLAYRPKSAIDLLPEQYRQNGLPLLSQTGFVYW